MQKLMSSTKNLNELAASETSATLTFRVHLRRMSGRLGRRIGCTAKMRGPAWEEMKWSSGIALMPEDAWPSG
jgi:hypothetical protein